MSEPARDSENYNELKFSREQGFFDKSLSLRLVIGLLFVSLFFCFLHFREVRVQVLELNTISPDYVVADVDVDFFDEEKTVLLQQDLSRDIGKIYQISDKSIRQRRIELENYLIYNQDWRKTAKNNPFEVMFKGLDAVESRLQHLRFTDPRTIQKMKEVDLPTADYLIYTPMEVDNNVTLPEKVWEHIKKTAFPARETESEGENFIINFLQNKTWGIEEDVRALKNLQSVIKQRVPDQYSHVKAGSRVIDKGEKVTARHMAIMQAIKHKLSEQRNVWDPWTVAGSLVLTFILTGIGISYFRINHPKILYSNRKLFLLVTIILLTFAISKAVEFLLLNSQYNLIDIIRYPLLVPLASILLCSLMNSSIATFISTFLVIVLTLSLSFDRQGFMILNFVAALVAIFSTNTLRHRKEVFVVCAKAWGCSLGLILAISFYHYGTVGIVTLGDMVSAAISMLLTAILVVGLLPLLESAFKIMTDVTLMEYMDPKNDLLKRLTIEAPGTYQHSIVVGNLTESAASAIGANGLFCRAAALYHDIGKMATPEYFTENQVGDVNMHQLLTPKESADVVMAHVSAGVSTARKAGLPEQFIDIIKEHHGTTLVYYFYRKQLELMRGDLTLVNESDFRYAGPKPRSKESAIIMIADSIEAASRSLDIVTEESLMALATGLIQDKTEDGQFDECLLTFEELAIVKNVLVKTLVAYGHTRVKYPPRERPTESQNLSSA